MTVFQLLHWNGSLKAMRERQCSRQVRILGGRGAWQRGCFEMAVVLEMMGPPDTRL